jgi:hypothetical protein
MKKFFTILISILLLTSCVSTSNPTTDSGHGFKSSLQGVAHLVLSPLQIVAGLIEGIAALPFYLSTNIHEINRALINGQAKITLDDTYESAYGKRLSTVPETGDTGEVFRRMKHATQYFQRVLKRYGVYEAEDYILTSIDTANSQGYTLFAVIHRPVDRIKVYDKYNPSITREFTKEERLFYEPFREDKQGRLLDSVIDFAGLPRDLVKSQKAQAILITIAANSVLEQKRSPEYWDIEKRWIGGEFREITEKRLNEVKRAMQIQSTASPTT